MLFDFATVLIHYLEKKKHSIGMIFGFLIMGYLILEVASYIISWHVQQVQTNSEIRSKFIERRANFEQVYQNKMYMLKETTEELISEVKPSFDSNKCEQLKNDLSIENLEKDVIDHAADMGFYFGKNGEIDQEFKSFIAWFDQNKVTCFYHIPNAQTELNNRVFSIQTKMWEKLYPSAVIKGIR